ncbi:MAG: GMP synthase subunit A [Candidatus Ranarchaeia archaeon]
MVYIPVVFNGGQYNSLIALALERTGVKTKLVENTASKSEFIEADGIIIGGGPWSLPQDLSKLGSIPVYLKELSVPILGVCLGHQLIALVYGGTIGTAKVPEYGKVRIKITDPSSPLVQDMGESFIAWSSHNDEVQKLPSGFKIIGSSEHCKTQIVENRDKKIWGIQFHAEVSHTPKGEHIYKNFIDIVKR